MTQQLMDGATLQGGKYRIQGALGQGGFGITYLAVQTGLDRTVAIKEFFMKEWCERDASTSHVTMGTEAGRATVGRFREKFMKEARNIARLEHPNIVRIHDIFEENGTCYYVMDYAGGGSLDDLVKRKGCLPEQEATRYILQVAGALAYVHAQNMTHLDVKPSNILLNDRGEAILIDFGLSKQYDAVSGGQTSTTPVGISEGYAPMEQYRQGGVSEFSPETDIYALGATFFKLLTGKTPPSASDIFEEGVPVRELRSRGVSQAAIAVITQAMEPKRKERMKDVRVVIQGISGNATIDTAANDNATSASSNSDSAEITRLSISPTFTVKTFREEGKQEEGKPKQNKLGWKYILGVFTLRVFLVYSLLRSLLILLTCCFDIYQNFIWTHIVIYGKAYCMAVASLVALIESFRGKKKSERGDYNRNREVLKLVRFGVFVGMAFVLIWCAFLLYLLVVVKCNPDSALCIGAAL